MLKKERYNQYTAGSDRRRNHNNNKKKQQEGKGGYTEPNHPNKSNQELNLQKRYTNAKDA
jgi:hypothetical protein